ncbi:MAG: malto-oligosyltrehalose synthase, partial [Actinomycetota bacterium]|nr:malto-oligosyltrehalose synthase [Actinomycetota bacterium]
MTPARTVGATYRVQLHRGFTFAEAGALAGYLADLGITHLYCSPYLQATPGSTHGYDVVDHSTLNEELGGAQGHAEMCAALDRSALGHIVDIVPNHMAAGPGNRWWWDVLRCGPASPYARYFDIEWEPSDKKLVRKVLLPILGDHYGRVLHRHELSIGHDDQDGWTVRYHEHRFPLSSASCEFAGDGVTAAIDRVNEDPSQLHELLEEQHYRLAFWRSGDRDLNYRRFFDVKTLAALRIDYREVFDDVHDLIFSLIDAGNLDGVRVDHIDGLYDPESYLVALSARVRDGYLIVEKILEPLEQLSQEWPVDGTTGYEFAVRVGQLFVDPAGEAGLTSLYSDFTGASTELEAIVRSNKLLILRASLASEVGRLAAIFQEVCEQHLDYRDHTVWELLEALTETIAAFPVYRTYVEPIEQRVTDQDIAWVDSALAVARSHRPDLDPGLFSFLGDVLLARHRGAAHAELVIRFQQLTGPAMAKGFEDTSLYVYNRLMSLNEVGGDPGSFGMTPE